MVDWLKKHGRAFWHSGPENLYTFIWWAIFTACFGAVVTLLLVVASYFGWFLPKLETAFLYFFAAFVVTAIIALVAQSVAARRGTAATKNREEIQDSPKQTPIVSAQSSSNTALAEAIKVMADPNVIGAAGVHPHFHTERPMSDLPASDWLKLGTLYDIESISNSWNIGNKTQTDKTHTLKLRFLPDTTDREEDALLLLLYGYRQIYGREKVEARKLERGLYLSNCRRQLPRQTAAQQAIEALSGHIREDRIDIDELAKSFALSGKISEKFDLATGGFYTITDRGVAVIEKLFLDLVRRA